MAVASRKEFIACVTKSKAIPAEKLKAWLDMVDDENPKKIATKLVRDKLLTPWQAKFLISGRSRLSVGNYLLQSRIARDELGDKFEAIHLQLNRKVVIQVFPSSVSKNDDLLKKLLTKLRQITELDHPNLVHVYDVDQESERYFLVTEFVAGKTLDLISPSDLTDSEISLIIHGIATGLTYAHASDIVHGNVTAQNIIVTPEGKAELQGFSSATVTSRTDHAPPTAAADFHRLGKIGTTLLKKLPDASRSEQYDVIANMIGGLSSDTECKTSVAALNDWANSHFATAAVSSDIQLQPEETSEEDSFVASGESAGAGGFDSPVAAVPATTLKKKKKSVATPEPAPRGFLKTMWEDKRPAFITCCAALLLSVLGGLGYVLSSSKTTITETSTDVDRSVALKRDVKDIPLATSNAAEGALSVERNNQPKQNVVDPETSRKALAEFFAKRDGKKVDNGQEKKKPVDVNSDQKKIEDTKSANTATATKPDQLADQETPSASTELNVDAKVDADESLSKPDGIPGTIDLTRISGIGDKTQAYLNDGGVKTIEQLAAMSQSEVQAAMVKGNWKGPSRIKESAQWIAQAKMLTGDGSPIKESTVSQTPTRAATPKADKPVEIGNPFENFAKLTDLPEATNTVDAKIGDLIIAKNHLLGLELLAEPAIARGKVDLTLNRSADDKQLWNVELTAKRSDPIAVAQFQKTPTEMKFRWLPAAAENNDANFLRNCKLKLSTPKDSTWLGLRSPVLIEGLGFAEDAAMAKAETEVNWLPNPEMLKVELQPFQIGGPDDRVGFNPREVTKRAPGRIFFREKEPERFFFIEVTTEIRKKTRFLAQMTVLVPGGGSQPLRAASDLVGYTQALEEQKNQALYQYEQSKTAKKPKNMEYKEFSRLKKEAEQNAETLTEMTDLSRLYVDLAKQLSGREIPIQIYFDMSGHRIVIAKSK